MRQLSALVFDAYGTLFDVHSVFQTAEKLFPGNGKALSQLWRTKQLEYTWLRSLMGRHADFNAVTQDALRFSCEAMSLDFSDEILGELNRAYQKLTPFPDAVNVLHELAGKKKLAILSNGAPDMLMAVVAHNQLVGAFEAILSVEDVRVFKPAPQVYRLATTRLGCTADEIGFVSSNSWDAAGAKAFGFRVFWVNRNNVPVEQLGVTPDHVLRTLEELPLLVA